jgi:hypothetical protein
LWWVRVPVVVAFVEAAVAVAFAVAEDAVAEDAPTGGI